MPTLPILGPPSVVTALQIFTEVFVVAAAQMSCQVYLVYPCLEDWLLVVLSFQEAISMILTLHNLLASQSICVNEEKSVLMPTKMINFTGLWLDSVMARAFLLADHFAS